MAFSTTNNKKFYLSGVVFLTVFIFSSSGFVAAQTGTPLTQNFARSIFCTINNLLGKYSCGQEIIPSESDIVPDVSFASVDEKTRPQIIQQIKQPVIERTIHTETIRETVTKDTTDHTTLKQDLLTTFTTQIDILRKEIYTNHNTPLEAVASNGTTPTPYDDTALWRAISQMNTGSAQSISSVNTDSQTLSIASNTLAITGGNSVSLAAYLDNTDTQLSQAQVGTYATNEGFIKTDTNTQLSEEQVEDFIGGMLGGTETGLTATYQDSTNDIDFEVTGVLQDLVTVGAPTTDGQFLVATGAGAFAYESGATARSSLTLGNVENTALSTWAGTTNITTLGTIATGVWGGTAIDISDYTNLTISATGLELSGDAIALTAGYNIPLTASTTDWTTAYDWGDHASGGYLTGITGQSIKSLSDVYSSMTPADGEVLTFDTTNGWQAEAGGVADTLTGLSCTDGQVASWDDGGSAWVCADGGFGAIESKLVDTEYQASSDGFVLVLAGSNGYYDVRVDTTSPATTVRSNGKAFSSYGSQASALIPIRSGEYWKVVNTYSSGPAAVSWVPFTGGGSADNFGDHTATQALNLNGNYLSGDGDAEGLFVDGSGNVGIGTTTPNRKLSVDGRIRSLSDGGGGSNEGGEINLNYATDSGTGDWRIDAYHGATAGNLLRFMDNSDVKMVIDQDSGRVGIGTSTPGHLLSVFKDNDASSTEIGIDNSDQRLILGAYYESGVAQYATIQSTDNAETGAQPLILNSSGGNVGIGTTTPTHPLHMDSGAHVTAGGSWTNASSRDLKENFISLNSMDILNSINTLDISQWNYKAEDASILHIGPIAQDFFAEFGLGGSDVSISTIDTAGVALIGIQALSQKFDNLFAGVSITKDGTLLVPNIEAENIKTDELEAKNICLGSTCITENTLRDLLNLDPLTEVSNVQNNPADVIDQEEEIPSEDDVLDSTDPIDQVEEITQEDEAEPLELTATSTTPLPEEPNPIEQATSIIEQTVEDSSLDVSEQSSDTSPDDHDGETQQEILAEPTENAIEEDVPQDVEIVDEENIETVLPDPAIETVTPQDQS